MTLEKATIAFNLPYNQSPCYWLGVFAAHNAVSGDNSMLRSALSSHGLNDSKGVGLYSLRIAEPWQQAWNRVRDLIRRYDITGQVEVSLIAGEAEPDVQEFGFKRKSVEDLDRMSSSLWLGDAMLRDLIVCYMQPVQDKRGKVFGYEAFARLETEARTVEGGQIIEASRNLNAEYMLDRYLHLKAISTFIASDVDDFLFINLIPGFIQRPEKYLEGLSDSARYNGMPARQIVVDFTRSEIPRDISHLKSILDYCRSQGYLLSLDDISSIPVTKKILETVRPDFIKLDIELVSNATDIARQRTISELVAIAHSAGATVIAEGVETEAVHAELLRAGVDLFQGYLFSPPVAVSMLKKVAG